MPLATTIDRVTVFPSGAEIVRSAEIDLAAGEHRLVVDNLPSGADPASLRVEARADGPLEIGDIDSAQIYVARDERGGEAERRRLEAEIEKLSDQASDIDARRPGLEAQKALMENLAQSPVHPAPDQMTEVDWASRFELIGDRLASVHAALNRQMIERREIDRQLEEARRKLRELGEERERRLAVTISLTAAKALTGRLELRYRVGNAGWVPFYEARLATGNGEGAADLLVVRRASVQQNSGEAWDKVALFLSTARMQGATGAPELASEWLDIEQPIAVAAPVHYGAAAADFMVTSMAPKRARSARMEEDQERGFADAAERETQIDAAGFQAVFEVPGRVDVAGRGTAKKLRLATVRLPARLEVRATPLIDPTAYLHAAFTLVDATALIPGMVQLYRDEVAVGQGVLPLVNVGETHELGFGALDRVQVRRIEQKVSKGRHGLIKSENTDERHYRIKVTNRHTTRLPVRLYERVPVARHDRIKVEILSDTSRFDEDNVDDRRGVVAFLAEVKPGGEAEFELHYRISWPKDERLAAS